MMELACVNGVFSLLEDARVSVNDRGFLFGDGVYEAIRSYGGRLWAMDRHMDRLERSLAEIRIPFHDIPQIRRWVLEGLDRSGIAEAMVYIQVTRGAAPRKHTFEEGLAPTVVLTIRPAAVLTTDQRRSGVAAITTPDLRWARRDIKTINLLPNVLAKHLAEQSGAFEAILVESDGRVTEGSSSNVFAVFGERVWTAPADHHILGGITRDLVMASASKVGVTIEEEVFSVEQLRCADEIFLSGTVSEVLAVISLDGSPVGAGVPGPATRKLAEAYADCIHRHGDCLDEPRPPALRGRNEG